MKDMRLTLGGLKPCPRGLSRKQFVEKRSEKSAEDIVPIEEYVLKGRSELVKPE